jgi:hypothetical protein
MARRYSKIGVNIAVPLWLTGAAGVGIALEAPIFVAVTLLFALVAYLGAALEAWTRRHPVNNQFGRISFLPPRSHGSRDE